MGRRGFRFLGTFNLLTGPARRGPPGPRSICADPGLSRGISPLVVGSEVKAQKTEDLLGHSVIKVEIDAPLGAVATTGIYARQCEVTAFGLRTLRRVKLASGRCHDSVSQRRVPG
jgi:hypothetical protein